MSLRVTARFCKVWDVEVNDNGYAKVNLGTSRKDKKTDEYVNTNWWGVSFVGEAKEFGANLVKGDVVEIVSGQLDNVYNKEKKVTYFNMVVFDAKKENNNKSEPKVQPKQSEVIEEEDDSFPF